MAPFAKVYLESPLPQLDRLFDYAIPIELEAELKIGQRVMVPFGRAAKATEGFVADIVEEIDFQGKVSPLSEIVWGHPIIPAKHLELLRAIADRQAVALGDVLKQALPTRAVRVEKSWVHTVPWIYREGSGKRNSVRVAPRIRPQDYGEAALWAPSWVHDAISISLDAVAEGTSALICVPDFRDIEVVKKALTTLGLENLLIDYSASQTRTQRYESYLSVLTQTPLIVVGTRSAMYAPVSNLGAIIVFDESDASHVDPASPYACTRDLALLRNQIHGTEIHFLAHCPSSAVLRLEKLNFLETAEGSVRPKVAFSSADLRLDDLAYSTIRRGLEIGPVLVQVSNLGVAKSAYCSKCSTRTKCRHCGGGGLWVNSKNQLACRICGALNLDFKCQECDSTTTRMGRAGSTRTASEFGKTFPGVSVLEATGDQVKIFIDGKPRIVIATPEAAPIPEHGYSAVVIIDTDVALARDFLAAREDAIRQWANSVALASEQGQVALIGVAPDIGSRFSTWQLDSLITQELSDRTQLRFPPTVRVLSILGDAAAVASAIEGFTSLDGVDVLGKTYEGPAVRAIIRFEYSRGAEVAALAKKISLDFASKPRISGTGRAARALTIKMDDLQVL